MALDAAYPSPDTNLTTVAQWEAFNVGLGGSTGVVQGVGSGFAVSLNSGTRSAVLAAGAALVRGFYSAKSSSESTAIPAASGSNRIDRLVLRLDRSQSGGTTWVKPVVITGTPSGSPQIPALQASTSGSWDLPIAHWTSASNGALTGLVDDRQYMAGDVTVFTSGSRPPATPIRLGIETNTRRVLWADGTAWNVLSQDTGWADLSLSAGFTQGGVPLAGRVKNSVAYLKGTVQVGPIIIPSGGQKIANIPAYLQPDKTIQINVYEDGGALLLAAAYASSARTGQLWLVGNVGNASPNTTLHFDTSWPA